MRGVCLVAVPLEHRPRRRQRRLGPAQVARDEGDLGLGEHAACPGHGFPRAEGAAGAPQQRPRPLEIAKLRHGDAAQRQRWRILSQRDPVQGTERIARWPAPAPQR